MPLLNRACWATVAVAVLTLFLLAACSFRQTPATVTRVVEVTRVVSGEANTVIETVTLVETRVVTVQAPPEQAGEESDLEVTEAPAKELVICTTQEPDSLYIYGSSVFGGSPLLHALYENNLTTLSYDYQAQGLDKVPSLADGDARLVEVEVRAGDVVLDASANVVSLQEGTMVHTAGRDAPVAFNGEPLIMQQMVVDFTLKPRVWSDGQPVTAGDSVFSFQLAADPVTPAGKSKVERTATYEAINERSTRWIGIPGFLDAEYFLNFWAPLPRHAWRHLSPAEMLEAEAANRAPIGDGPFKVAEWIDGEFIRLVRNEHYYRSGEGLPTVDIVTFRFIADSDQVLAQLLSSDCDIATRDALPRDQWPSLIEAEKSGLLALSVAPDTIFEHIAFGINSYGAYGDGIGRADWFEDGRVRQAMTMCTDRQKMVDELLYGRSEVMHSYLPAIHPLHPDDLARWPYDVARANRLLDEVGYVDGDEDGIRNHPEGDEPFAVTLMIQEDNELRRQLAQRFQQNMSDCGIQVQLGYLPAGDLYAGGADSPLFGRRFDLAEFPWLTGISPLCQLYLSSEIPGPLDETIPGHYEPGQALAGWSGLNAAGWIDPAYDAACRRALDSLPGTPAYAGSHRQALRIFAEQLPVIPLFMPLQLAAARPEVQNFGLDPTQDSELWNLFEIDLE